MKVGVITFPGSNGDHDMRYAFRTLGYEVCALWHKDTNLQGVDMVILPGGFSYGDYLRSGSIATLSPIMEAVKKFAKEGGKVLGICNGFQMLTEMGLLSGALLKNDHGRFVSKNVYIRPSESSPYFSSLFEETNTLLIPVAHGEGRYYVDDDTLKEMYSNGQVLLQYCDQDSRINSTHNPNGSVDSIACVSNKAKNVIGMMPHPERAAASHLYNTQGVYILHQIAKG